MHPVTVLRKINCLPCSSSSLEAVIAGLAHLIKIRGFILAGWVSACKGPESSAIQVIKLPQFRLGKNSIAALLLTVENMFIFVLRVRF